MTETITMPRTSRGYSAGVALAALTSFLSIWTTIVRDDGSGAGFFLVIMAVGVGAFATRATAEGMGRTMLGVAVMQATMGLATATAPITAQFPDGVFKAIVFNGVGTALWALSAIFFFAAARNGRDG